MRDLPEIISTLRITGRKGLGGVREVLEASNTAFTNGLAAWAGSCWVNGLGTYPMMAQIPWKHPNGKYVNDTTIWCQQLYSASYMTYPGWGNGGGALGSSTSDRDLQRFYMRQTTVQNYNTAFIPHVIGSVCTTYNGAYNGYPYLISVAEVPGTQIGNYFPHPLGPNGSLASTTTGNGYFLTANSPTWSSTYGGDGRFALHYRPGVVDTLRITSGTDKGIYHIKRAYPGNPAGAVVTHIDGSAVLWLNTTTQSVYFNNRMCFGNETGVIALSAGSVTFGGTFAPGASRNSYMVKIRYDKSGNTTAGTTQGSYWFSLRPYTHGANSDHEQFYFQSIMFGRQDVAPSSQGLDWSNAASNAKIWNNTTKGGIKSYALDPINQRLWYAISDGSTNSGIGFWLYKTVENVHEVANSAGGSASGSAALLSQSIQMASTVCYSVDAGTDGTIYAALYSPSGSGNAGLVTIAPDFTTTIYNNSGGGCPGTKFTCAKVDKTKNRAGTDASFSGTNHFLSASGSFSSLDLGRVIKITGGANAGTYKISVINSATDVTVVVPSTGAAITWANNALTGQTWAIGDRIWCFFNDTTTNSAKLYYMESTLLGTWLNQVVTMTNAKQCGAVGDLAPGHGGCAAVDPKNGTVYWISTDTNNQINQYVPGAATVTSINGPDLGGKSGTDASMTSTQNTITSASGNFSTAVDLGRAITITGGANAGTYKISAVNSTTNITVTTPVGGAVSWASTLSAQTWATAFKGRAGGVPAAGGFLTIGVNPVFSEVWAGSLDTSGGLGQGTYRFDTSVTFDAAHWNIDTTVQGAYYGNLDSYGASSLGWRTSEAGGGFYDTAASITFGPDGRVYATHWNARSSGAGRTMFGMYTRESDNWQQMSGWNDAGNVVATYQTLAPAGIPTAGLWTSLWADPYGGIVWINPQSSDTTIGNSQSLGFFGHLSVDYQWISSAWTPKEAVRGPLPAKSVSDNSAYATGLKTKPLHSTADTLIYGVTIQFTQTAGTSYNDFVGRFACTLDNKSDGATSAGTATSATFTGSGFSASDAGRYLRLESGANAGIYKITAFTDANHVTIAVLNGTSFTLSTLSTLNYSVWDAGDPTGASGVNGGPETGTIMLSNGFGKDNTQDVNGVQMDFATAKTVLSDQTDTIKFAIDPPGVPLSATLQVYSDFVNGSNSGAWPRHRGLGSLATHIQPIDGLTDRVLDGSASRASMGVTNTNNRNSHDGFHFAVDFGRDVEVGSIIARRYTSGFNDGTWFGQTLANLASGQLVELLNAPDGSAPVQSDGGSARCTGTGLYAGTGTEAAWTNQTTDGNGYYLRVTSGNFMGSNDAGFPRSVGSISTGGNVLTDAGASFAQSHVGHALNITAGSAADIGWYRIISVVTNTSVTIAPLNNKRTGAVTAFVNSVSSGITYTVTNAVQDGDIIKATTGPRYMVVYSVEEPTTCLCTTEYDSANIISNSAWSAYAPTWNLVKNMFNGSFSIYYAPGTIGNKTFQSTNSKFRGVPTEDPMDFFDLSDLTTAKRTGRWWRVGWMQLPAWTRTPNAANWGTGTSYLDQLEFYDPSGKNLITHPYNRVDTYDSNPNFMRANVTRVDWIQCTSSAGASGSNGLVDVSGTTATLHTGGNVFLGHHVRKFPAGGGCTAAGSNNILTASANFFMPSDVGRIINIPAGVNVGYYKVLAYSSATSVTLVTPNGSGVSLTADATQRIVDIYEGIGSGDYLAITTGGVSNSNAEYQISTVANNLQTLTLVAGPAAAITSQNWEIRRRANLIGSTCWAQVTVSGTYALSSGDFHHDSSGHVKTASVDQTAYTTAVATAIFSPKADGATTISTGTFTGSDFHQDDVGKVLMIQSGADKGHYKISVFTSSTQVTVVNLYTGAAISFSASAGSLSYIIKGDRRFRISRYTSVVRA